MSRTLNFETAIESHRRELTRYCRRRLGSDFDAEDAVQETLLRAWRSVDGLHQPEALRSWLYQIAGHVCIDAVNRRARQPIPTDDWAASLDHSTELDPAELLLAREDLRLAVSAAVHRLPPRQRAVFLLREILCWQAAEVAAFLATSVVAVNSALQRARATLDRNKAGHSVANEDESRRSLVTRYLIAFDADDVDALTELSWSGRAQAAVAG